LVHPSARRRSDTAVQDHRRRFEFDLGATHPPRRRQRHTQLLLLGSVIILSLILPFDVLAQRQQVC
jgi:hypothetical protein